jgi:hypothetical protein
LCHGASGNGVTSRKNNARATRRKPRVGAPGYRLVQNLCRRALPQFPKHDVRARNGRRLASQPRRIFRACPAWLPRLRKPQARSSRKIHQPAKGGLKRTHNALKAPTMGSLRRAKTDTLLELYQPRTTRRDHLHAALPKSNRPMQTPHARRVTQPML